MVTMKIYATLPASMAIVLGKNTANIYPKGFFAWTNSTVCSETCSCITTGVPVTLPAYVNVSTCPATGLDDSFMPLCQFACEYGYCPTITCQVVASGFYCEIIPYGGIFAANLSSLSSQSSCIDLGAGK